MFRGDLLPPVIDQYLERLYTWESLENTERGVEFELKNRLVETTVEGVTRVALDGEVVPPGAVTLERSGDERYAATEITPEEPLALDLGETVRVILETERLRPGIHELEVGLLIAGQGEVAFTVDDQIAEEDLLDVDPAELTVAELRSIAADIREPTTLERLLAAEQEGDARKTAIALLEDRLEATDTRHPEGAGPAEPTGRPADGTLVTALLVEALASPRQVSVYLAVQALGGGTPTEIAGRTLMSERAVAATLEDLGRRGLAERDEEGRYRVVDPVTALLQRQHDLWTVLRSAF